MKGNRGRDDLFRRMTARDTTEANRTATPLELLFDLCFVVAVAGAGRQLVDAFTHGTLTLGVIGYLYVFFGIWWAWMNFTWFATAYDVDDVPYRILTLLQMAGVLVYAAGVPREFTLGDWRLAVIGYVMMRLALTVQWLRVAHDARGPQRRLATRWALALIAVQLGWVGMLFVPEPGPWFIFPVLAGVELTVPAFAQRVAPLPWHGHHIAERYGLFTLIVLGESIAAATVAIQSGITQHEQPRLLLPLAGGGLLIVFAVWWIYFAAPATRVLESRPRTFLWAYGHYLIFGAVGALGAGLEVAVTQSLGNTAFGPVAAATAITVPLALLLLAIHLLHAGPAAGGRGRAIVLPATAIVVLATTFTGTLAVPLAGLACAAAVALSLGTGSARTSG